MSTDDFYSCSADDPTTLLTSGASHVVVSYQYEIETSYTSDAATLDEAVERVQASMLHSIAQQTGLVDCAGVAGPHDPWRRLRGVDETGVGGADHQQQLLDKESIELRGRKGAHEGHRWLRAGGRGSTSIVGLSSLPGDKPLDVLCRADAMDLATTRVDAPFEQDPFDSMEPEVDPGMAGAVVMNPEPETEKDSAGESDGGQSDHTGSGAGIDSDVVLASTRIDGKVNILKIAPRSITNLEDSNEESSVDSNDGLDLAFNYISTQSLPIERSSHTSHNPLTAPAIFKQRSQLNAQPTTTTSETSPKVVSSTEVKQTRFTRKCTVIQGQMSVYSSAASDSTYENLEGRILQALTHEVNNNMATFTTDDNVVLAVRMHDNSPVNIDPISSSPGFVTVSPIKGGLSTRENNEGFSFTTPMAILMALGCLFIGLSALFVHTSKPRQRRLHKDDRSRTSGDMSAGMGTYCDDEVEMDVNRVEKDLKFMETYEEEEEDDYSVGKFSVSSAREQSVYSPRRLFGGSPKKKSRRGTNDNYSSPIPTTPTQNTEDDGPAPIQSAILGLFTARPRAVSPDLHSEVELDVTSVYDCDATERNESFAVHDGGTANLVADIHKPLPGEEERKAQQKKDTTKSSYFGGLFSSSARSAPAMPKSSSTSGVQQQQHGKINLKHIDSNLYVGPVDMDALMSIDGTNTHAAASARAAPSSSEEPSPKKSLLRFFSAKEQQRERCVSPHSEVEASLAPFDDVSEYSETNPQRKRRKSELREVESKYMVPVTTNEDRIILMNSEEESSQDDDDNKKSLTQKFSRFFKRGKPTNGGNGLYVQEIHEIYSNDKDDDDRVSRKPSPDTTSVYTMQRKPSSPLKPVGFYKSPSSLSNKRTRSQRSEGVADESSTYLLQEEEEEGATRRDNTRCMIEIGEDDGSVAVDCGGPMCDMAEYLRPKAWC